MGGGSKRGGMGKGRHLDVVREKVKRGEGCCEVTGGMVRGGSEGGEGLG